MTKDAFDPYFKWLGIPPEHQPPDHYRLLGIPHFVCDPEVIQNAADQRMMLVKSLQTGRHTDWSQRLLLEVAKARRCLLTPEAKDHYDAALRQQMSAEAVAKSPPTVAPPVVGPAPPPPRLAPARPPAGQVPSGIDMPHQPNQRNRPAPVVSKSPPAESLTVSRFFDKALRAGRDIKAQAMSAARRTTLLAEKTKVESIDLPRAFRALGRDIVTSGRFRDELADYYRRVQRVADLLRDAESHDDDDDEPHSLAEFAASAAERLKDVVSRPGILSKLNAAYAELGEAAFTAFGEKSGSPGLVAPIVTHRCRLAELQRELAADS